METLKIAFTDFWPEWNVEDFITPILKEKYNVIIDQKNPDVLFHSIFNRMNDTPKYKCKKVLILAENWRASQFKSHYSISFDPTSDTNFRLPLWQMYWLLKPELKDRLFDKKKHESFERFCAFTVSNPYNGTRNNHFDQLSQYKRVHSYGKVRMNDFGLKKASAGRYWRDAKDEFFLQHPHKFMMTYENTSYPWYCTEKIMDGFLAGSIPLYWGDPKVVVDWNLDAFVNVQKLGFSWVDAVKKIDQDNSLFNDIYNAPVFKEDQKKKHLENLEEFKNWLIEIVKK
jgi:alpha(1,3/1,4) fucosyltransferase